MLIRWMYIVFNIAARFIMFMESTHDFLMACTQPPFVILHSSSAK